MLGVRYWLLPNIDQYSPQISAAISQAAKQRIVIGTIRGDWDGLRPRLELQDVRLYDAQGRERLVLAAVDSTLSWASLLAFEPLFHSIELTGLSFEVRRDASGALQIAGIALGGGGHGDDAGLADWLLRQRRVTLRDSEVTWVDETLGGTPVQLKQVQLEVQRLFRRNRFGLRAVPPLEVASPIDLRGDLDGGTVRDLRRVEGAAVPADRLRRPGRPAPMGAAAGADRSRRRWHGGVGRVCRRARCEPSPPMSGCPACALVCAPICPSSSWNGCKGGWRGRPGRGTSSSRHGH